MKYRQTDKSNVELNLKKKNTSIITTEKKQKQDSINDAQLT